MTLSADTLNQRSPYALMQLGELTFRFVTDQQIHYTVGFKRLAARDRLYHLWFYDYARSHEMTLFSDSVSFKSVNYYAGILMRHDHPLHDMILSYYQDFLKHVPQLYAPRDK